MRAAVEMNGVQNRRVHNVEKPFPGCLGRMVNLFDLTGDVNGNKLLTDRPHRDGDLPLSLFVFTLFGFSCCHWEFSFLTPQNYCFDW